MRVITLIVFTLALGCNRPAQVVNTGNEKTPRPTQASPQVPGGLRNADLPGTAQEDTVEYEQDADIRASTSRRRQETYTVDPVTGERVPLVWVELSKTPCEPDTCADYTIQLLADYTFHYEGRSNVPLLGEFTGKADFNPMLKLIPMLFRHDFRNMDALYPVDWTATKPQQPTTITTINYKGRSNTVVNVHGAPAGLLEIENEILSWEQRVIWSPKE